MTEQEAIAFLTEHGYKVTRARKPSRPRSQRKLLDQHLRGEHRGSYDETCRACRFARTITRHRAHTFNVEGCALCVDRAMSPYYLFPSTFVGARYRAA